MSVTLQAPRFRTTSRLILWARRNRPAGRLPVESERCFFRTKEAPERVSANLVRYASMVGDVGEELESLVLVGDVYGYGVELARRGVAVRESVLERMDEGELARFASYLNGRRLSERFERRIVTPGVAQHYCEVVGGATPYLESLILQDVECCMRHIKFLLNRGESPDERFLRMLAGHDRYFIELCGRIGGRLPDYLLDTVKDPDVALQYAARFLKGRLPAHLESVFMDSPRHAVRYAFDVVRAFSSPRLPDFLHNAVVLSVNADVSEVRRYVTEVERTSEKPAVEGA